MNFKQSQLFQRFSHVSPTFDSRPRKSYRLHMMKLRFALLWMTSILLMASVVRFAGIDTQSIWFDEGWSAYAAVQPDLLAAARADLTNPPLYYMLLHVSARFFGSSEYALRWVSTALNLITLALIYALARDLFDKRVGLYAAALAACSALLWWASQEARMYTLMALLVTLAAFAWHRLRSKPSLVAWVVLWLAELALLYSHNTGPIAAIWLNIVTVLAWISTRSLRRPNWRLWMAGQVGVFLLWLPWLDLFLEVSRANAAISSAPTLSFPFALEVWSGLALGNWALVATPLTIIIGTPMLIVSLLTLRWGSPSTRWLLLHVALLVGGIILGLIILSNEYHGRYAALAMPLLVIVLGAGIARLRWRLVRYAVITCFVIAFVVVHLWTQDPLYGHDDARGMVQHYANTLTADDTVLAWSYADRYDLWYYWARLGVQARRVTLPEGADMDTIAPLLPTRGGVSINTWFTQRADYRGMLPCVISHLTTQSPRTFTTSGMRDLYFVERSPEIPSQRPTVLPFVQGQTPIAEITALGLLPETSADQAICIPVNLRNLQDATIERSVALIVRNALGWEVARADAIIARADGGAELLVGEDAAAFPLLRLPYGAPTGEYEVYLRLYDGTMPSGYQPAAPERQTSGLDVLIGTWRVSASSDWAATGRAPTEQAVYQLITPNLQLLDATINAPTPLRNGDAVRLTMLWAGRGDLPALQLRAEAAEWVTTFEPTTERVEGVLLDWQVLRIPPDTPAGELQLVLQDGTQLARLQIEHLAALYEPPLVQTLDNASFPDVGLLYGHAWQEQPFALDTPPEITLVWQAGDTPILADYTVFVQLLNVDGLVIAQSDAMPEGGSRPTTTWRAGEFIVDRHRLTYNTLAAPGRTQLIVGWYDARDNRRLLLENGRDSYALGDVEVSGSP
jgi:uncharacterized membrane protein